MGGELSGRGIPSLMRVLEGKSKRCVDSLGGLCPNQKAKTQRKDEACDTRVYGSHRVVSNCVCAGRNSGAPILRAPSDSAKTKNAPVAEATLSVWVEKPPLIHLYAAISRHGAGESRSSETSVEQKSVLDCRRISRNFSQTRGQL